MQGFNHFLDNKCAVLDKNLLFLRYNSLNVVISDLNDSDFSTAEKPPLSNFGVAGAISKEM